jgi:epoxide hydrolase 4
MTEQIFSANAPGAKATSTTGLFSKAMCAAALAMLACSAQFAWALSPGVTCKATAVPPKTAFQKSYDNFRWGKWENFDELDVQLNGLPQPEPSARYHLLSKRPGAAPALDKPVVLFIHGFPEFSWAWENWQKLIGTQHDTLAIDLKGFGSSSRPVPIAAYEIGRLTDEIDNVIQCLGYTKVIPVAHDWGGTIGWQYAIRHRNRVQAMVMLSTPHPYTYSREAAIPDSDQRKRALYIEQIRENSPKSMSAFINGTTKDTSLFGPFYKGNRGNRLLSTNMNTLAKWDRMFSLYRVIDYPPKPEDFPAQPTPETLAALSVNVPVLAFWGTADIYFSPESWRGVEAFAPQMQVEVLEGAGHFIDHDVPELPGKALAFINKVVGR